MTIVDINRSAASTVDTSDREVFDFLVFHTDGTLSIQTNKSIYFYATALFIGARDVNRLFNGDTSTLEYGIPQNMVNPENPDNLPILIVKRATIQEALEADKITSNWPGVLRFFGFLTELHDAKSSV